MITQLPTPCWHLIDAAGQPYGDPDWRPHYLTHEAATRAVNDYELEGVTPQILDTPCWVGQCNGCGDEPDWDEGGGAHFATLADLKTSFEAYEFEIDGVNVWCPDARIDPDAHDQEQIPGQTELTEAGTS